MLYVFDVSYTGKLLQGKLCVLSGKWLFMVKVLLQHFCRLVLLIDNKAMVHRKGFVIE